MHLLLDVQCLFSWRQSSGHCCLEYLEVSVLGKLELSGNISLLLITEVDPGFHRRGNSMMAKFEPRSVICRKPR